MERRVALYLRVSTTRQAEKDLSIPDQRRQAEAYCEAKGWVIVAEYVEPGASATDDRRPAFQRMINDACAAAQPFDVVLVHSLSRFFRDAVNSGLYQRKLEKHGVEVVSITQDFGNDATGRFVKQIVAAADELSSAENAKHTLRAMKENARQGFWNGLRPPIGYRVVEAERRGDKIKKRLKIDPAEAEILRLIFDLYRHGDGRNGPLGIKAIVTHLNNKGLRQRKGSRFTTKTVHEILTRTTYAGRHYFNRRHCKTGKTKPRDEWIEMAVPAIIDPAVFEEVQARLASRRPENTPPRVVNGPTLLTGLAICAACGGGMTLRTGKGGRYRYYACATCMRKGKTACKGRSLPMGLLDDLVIDALLDRLLTPDRVAQLISGLTERVANDSNARQARLKALNKKLREIDAVIARLYKALEDGLVSDSDSFRNRLSGHEQRREEVMRLIAMTKRRLDQPRSLITPRKIEAFTTAMRDRLRSGDSKFRKTYLRLFVERIEVDDGEVRICGSKDALEKGVSEAASLQKGVVPSFVQEWRPLRESNPCLHLERVVSWTSRRRGRVGRHLEARSGKIKPFWRRSARGSPLGVGDVVDEELHPVAAIAGVGAQVSRDMERRAARVEKRRADRRFGAAKGDRVEPPTPLARQHAAHVAPAHHVDAHHPAAGEGEARLGVADAEGADARQQADELGGRRAHGDRPVEPKRRGGAHLGHRLGEPRREEGAQRR